MPKGMMKALWYNAVCICALMSVLLTSVQPRDFVIKQVPIPQIDDDEVLLKGEYMRLSFVVDDLIDVSSSQLLR